MPGYDITTFLQKPPTRLICSICDQVLRDPQQCMNGHLFCSSCIADRLLDDPTCPTCQCELSKDKLSRNIFVRDTIGDMQARCFLQCGWVGAINDVDPHLERECSENVIICLNVDCVDRMKRMEWEEHDKNCSHKIIICKFCATNFKRLEEMEHDDNCELKPVPCRHDECGMEIPRVQMSEHLLNCLWEEVECPYAGLGCTAKCPQAGLRKDINAHVFDSSTMAAIIGSFLRKSVADAEQIASLRITIAQLEDKLAEQQMKHDALEVSITGVSASVTSLKTMLDAELPNLGDEISQLKVGRAKLEEEDAMLQLTIDSQSAKLGQTLQEFQDSVDVRVSSLEGNLRKLDENVALQTHKITTIEQVNYDLDVSGTLQRWMDVGCVVGNVRELLTSKSVTGELWTTHHVAWEARSPHFCASDKALDMESPRKPLVPGVLGCMWLRRECGGNIRCFAHLAGFRGTAEYTIMMFRSGGEPKKGSGSDVWDRDTGWGFGKFLSQHSFESNGYILNETVHLLLTLHLKH